MFRGLMLAAQWMGDLRFLRECCFISSKIFLVFGAIFLVFSSFGSPSIEAADAPDSTTTLGDLPWNIEDDIQEIVDNIPLELEGEQLIAKVTIRDMLILALKLSTDIRSVQVSEKIAQSALTASEKRWFSTLRSQAGYTKSSTVGGGDPNAFLNLSDSDALSVSATYEQPLNNGLSYSLTYQEQRSRLRPLTIEDEGNDPEVGTYEDWLDINALNASVTIPLDQDWGEEFNDLPIRFSELEVSRSALDTRQSELSVMDFVGSTYWDLVGILEAIRVQKEAVEISKRLMEENRLRLEVGVLSRADVRITETQLARERQTLLSQQLDAQRVEDQVRAALNIDLTNLNFIPIDIPKVHDEEQDIESLLKRVYANDVTLGQLENSLQTNQYELIQTQNKEKHDLDLTVGYTVNGYSESPVQGAQYFFQPLLHGVNAQLTWTVPFYDSVIAEEKRQNQLAAESLRLQIRSRRTNLRVQLQSILHSLRLAKQEVLTSQETQKLSQEQLQDEIDRFRTGNSTSFQVSQFQQDALVANQQETLARVNYEKFFLQLLLLTHDLFDYYQLRDE